MVYRMAEQKTEQRERMRGGEGVVSLTHLVPSEKLFQARLMARVEVPIGASIGEHFHEKEVEYYIVVQGQGEIKEKEKISLVGPGDVVITGPNEGHAIRNSGSEPLVFFAFIQTLL